MLVEVKPIVDVGVAKGLEPPKDFAGGVYRLEFAREIFRRLETFSDADIDNWFNLYKHGVWSPELGRV